MSGARVAGGCGRRGSPGARVPQCRREDLLLRLHYAASCAARALSLGVTERERGIRAAITDRQAEPEDRKDAPRRTQ